MMDAIESQESFHLRNWKEHRLAGLLFAQGERKQAITYYRKFHKQYPSDEIGAVNLAGALATTNEMQTAVQVIQEFLKVRPDAQQARSLLSRLRAP